MAAPKTVTMDIEEPEAATPARPDINKSIQEEVAKKIKSRFMAVDTVSGTAQMFDTNNYHNRARTLSKSHNFLHKN